MGDKVLVTGATGNVGGEVLRMLRREGRPVRAATTDVERARSTLGEEVELVRFDFKDRATFAPALRDVRALFLVRPPAIAQVKQFIYPAIDAARAAGVEHVVLLSLLGAEKNPVVPHRKIETYLEGSGMAYTFLRASFFMQNLSTVHRDEIRQRDEIFVPAGRGKTSFVDVRDIAAVAVRVLGNPAHANRAYDLTGDEALDYYEVAGILGDVLGRPIRYRDPSPWRFARDAQARGVAPGFIMVMLGIYLTARLGLAARVAPDTARLLGRPATTLRRYVEDYQEWWRE